jgi:molecular chaperone Hsp33
VPDRLITAIATDGSVALVGGVTTDLVRETQLRHGLAPTASAAVGRLVTGAALLGASLKGRERLSLHVVGAGPLGSITADAALVDERTIGARAYAQCPHVDLPLNDRGKFDVGGAIGAGKMQVTKSFELGQPYVGIVPLESGEIGDDLASYLLSSQQIPSVVALGVLANPSGIIAAGGVIAQVMPSADESTIARLEHQARTMSAVTAQIGGGASAEDLIAALAGDLELRPPREYAVRFACRCTREKVEIALLGLGRDELARLAEEQPQTEATCEFCKRRYVLTADEVSGLIERLEAR